MKIFLSFISDDKQIADKIVNRLKSDGHEVMENAFKQAEGVSLQTRLNERDKSDALVILLSENTRKSRWAQYELSYLALHQVFYKSKKKIIPVKVDKIELPSYLTQYQYVDLSINIDTGLDKLSTALGAKLSPASDDVKRALEQAVVAADTQDKQIESLRKVLRKGRLTLVCGAGTSVEAGIPEWNALLIRLLESMLEKVSKDHKLDLGEKAAHEFQKRHGTSALILGKYLKNNLGKDFPAQMRDALYQIQPKKSELIKSVVELSRPQRDAKPLDSIITFNFDNLIEENLKEAGIAHKSIFSEAIHHDEKEIPIYHVHGFLPHTGKIPADSELVFSEDAYHSQFIDPFSWSNLIQLNKLTQNICLFVGISLTDPNMRRLLDVAWRKNPDKTLSHYMVRKSPRFSDGDVLDDVSKILEEQDANALGLNVIWINDYLEIPKILTNIAKSTD